MNEAGLDKRLPWHEWWKLLRRRGLWALPLAVLAALVVAAINEAAYERSRTALEELGRRAQARGQIQLVWRSLIEAESGQRGYLLTGRPEYLLPYADGVTQANDALRWLNDYYRSQPEGRRVLDEIGGHARVKLGELATTLQMHDQGRHQAWRELMLTEIGRERMDALRQAAQRLLEIESRQIDAERGDVFTTLRNARGGITAMTALSLLALVLFLLQAASLARERMVHAEALRAERDRLEAEVGHRTSELTELARHLQTAREDEKARLARELHDELGALLTAAKLDAARLKRLIASQGGGAGGSAGGGAPASVPTTSDETAAMQARLSHLTDSIDRGIGLKRRIIEDLRPSALSNLGLVAALEILAREHAERSSVQLDCALQPVVLDDAAQITAYRSVQEALTNAARYAQAQRLHISLAPTPPSAAQPAGGARLLVADDGVGFDPATRAASSHGLVGMRYRVEAEGGSLQLRSRPGAGTEIEVWLPTRVAVAD